MCLFIVMLMLKMKEIFWIKWKTHIISSPFLSFSYHPQHKWSTSLICTLTHIYIYWFLSSSYKLKYLTTVLNWFGIDPCRLVGNTWINDPYFDSGQQARWHAEIYVIFHADKICHTDTEVTCRAEIPEWLSV